MPSRKKKMRPNDATSCNASDTRTCPIPEDISSPSERFLGDRRQLLIVFPEEVWEHVFKKVEDPKSLECLSNSSLFLRQLLAPQRVEFLFPTVLEITARNDNVVDKNAISWLLEEDICPLKLRSVSKSWNKTIDTMIDNHPSHFYVEDDTQAEFRLDEWEQDEFDKLFDNTFYEASDFNTLLLNRFDCTHVNADRNPLVGRSITIKFQDRLDEQEIKTTFMPAVRSVLQKYGIHIFYLTVSFEEASACLSDNLLYSLIREFLQLMPNLKVFKYIKDTPARNSSEKELIELKSLVKSSPLPTLPGLQMLAADDLPFPIFKELIRSNNKIVTLDVSKIHLNHCLMMSTVPFPHLTTFAMHSRSWDTDQKISIRHLQDQMLNWPLTKLDLDFSDEGPMCWEPVFNTVNTFSSTLTHLRLGLPSLSEYQGRVKEVNPLLRLDLPHLKNLSLSMRNVTSLDFLLPTKDSLQDFDLSMDLQRISLELLRQAETGSEKIIKFFSCPGWKSGGCYESNMWTLFPNLTRIECTVKARVNCFALNFRKCTRFWRSCSRQQWIRRANQQNPL